MHATPPEEALTRPLKVAVFSAKSYDKDFLRTTYATKQDLLPGVELVFHRNGLKPSTAPLVESAEAVCAFVNDKLDAAVLAELRAKGVRAVLLRCAGHDNVDLAAAARLGLFVANVRAYSPEAVAEFAVAMMQTLNRKTHRAYNRVREGNFDLSGLVGRTLHGQTVGVVGLGRIGLALARILAGYGCRLLGYDPYSDGAAFAPFGEVVPELDALLARCDIVSLHCPLVPSTRHLIDAAAVGKMKPGAVLVNTSRGGLIHTKAVVAALKRRHLAGLATDVFEGEEGLFYEDHSGDIIEDEDLMSLMHFPNVLLCGHQAFLTEEALREIAKTTLDNLADYMAGRPCPNALVQGGKEV